MAQRLIHAEGSTADIHRRIERIEQLIEQANTTVGNTLLLQGELACLRSILQEHQERDKQDVAPTEERRRPVVYVFPRQRYLTDDDTELEAWFLERRIKRRLGLLSPLGVPSPSPSLGRGTGRGAAVLATLRQPGFQPAELPADVPATVTGLPPLNPPPWVRSSTAVVAASTSPPDAPFQDSSEERCD